MRFLRKLRQPPHGVPPRRLAGAKRALEAHVAKAPLFAEQIRLTQETPEGRIRRADESFAEGWAPYSTEKDRWFLP